MLVLSSVVLAAAIAAAVSVLAISPDRIFPRSWKGYYTLYIQKTDETEDLVRRIAATRGIDAVVSRYTSSVSFNTFAGFDTVSIDKIPERLDPLDPRLDPYMKKVERLFAVREGDTVWEVLYLRSETNLLFAALRLHRALQRQSLRWRLLEVDFPAKSVSLGLFLLYLLVLVVLQRSALVRCAACLGALPWLFVVLLGGFFSLLCFFALYPLWLAVIGYLHDTWKDRLFFPRETARRVFAAGSIRKRIREKIHSRSGFLRIAVFLGTGIALALMSAQALPGVAVSLACGLLIVPFIYCTLVHNLSRRAHPPFQRLEILKRFRLDRSRRTLSRNHGAQIVLIALVLASYPMLRLAESSSSKPEQMIRMNGEGHEADGLSWSSLSALSVASGDSELPDLADYLSHRAYQEALIFGRPYGFPALGERITISEYQDFRDGEDNRRILKTYRVVKQFKASWLEQSLLDAAPGSVAALLIDQQVAAPLVVAPVGDLVAVGAVSAGIGTFLALLFLMSLFFKGCLDLTASVLYATRSLTLRRR